MNLLFEVPMANMAEAGLVSILRRRHAEYITALLIKVVLHPPDSGQWYTMEWEGIRILSR